MEINIKLNVAEIGTIISEDACSISASKNMDKNGMRMSDAAISFLEDILKLDVDDEDMPFPENEGNKDKPDFNWDAFKKGNIAVKCTSIYECIDFLKGCNEMDVKWTDGSVATDLSGVPVSMDEMPLYFFVNLEDDGLVYDFDYKENTNIKKVIKWGDIND